MGWIEDATADLLGRRTAEGVWGYREGRSPSVEATALACLGLLARGEEANRAPFNSAVRRGADWLAALQGPDGSLGVSPELPEPGWATPLAMLLWNALRLYPERRSRAAHWLLGREGHTLPRDSSVGVVGHDPTLVGWPWTLGTHSWLEPTAMAILALHEEESQPSPRVEEGMRVIADRSLPHGGWNYGNKSVFGRELRPHPAPSGLALLALATRPSRVRPRSVDPAIRYLHRTLPALRAPVSLGWGTLGLRAWGSAPPESEDWLGRSHAAFRERPDVTAGLGLLLLAATNEGPKLLGIRALTAADRRPVGRDDDRKTSKRMPG